MNKQSRKPVNWKEKAIREMRNSVHKITNPENHEWWFKKLGPRETYEVFRRDNIRARASKRRLMAGSAKKTIELTFSLAIPQHSSIVKQNIKQILENGKSRN